MTSRRPLSHDAAVNCSSRDKDLPLLQHRFRTEVAAGDAEPGAAADRSRALAVWMLERWREDRNASRHGDETTPAGHTSFTPTRADLN